MYIGTKTELCLDKQVTYYLEGYPWQARRWLRVSEGSSPGQCELRANNKQALYSMQQGVTADTNSKSLKHCPFF